MNLPHHQPIRALLVSPEAGQKLRAEAGRMAAWDLTARQMADLELLTGGGFLPLRGFLTQADYDSVLAGMRLTTGALWPMPVVLEVGADFAAQVDPGEDIALRGPDGAVMAILSVTDKWSPDRAREAELLFGSADPAHPGVTLQRAAGPICLGGPVKGLPGAGDTRRGPNGWRAHFRAQGCERVLACDPADAAAGGRLAGELGAELLAVGAEPRHAGGRETLWQALIRRNHGATHLLLPADPAAPALLRQYRDEIGLELVDGEGRSIP
ncbi:transcription antiterminator BlgG [Paracoccus denitrificans]|jgi:sulfate adenylyltransferase|nr:transcription antiterminator BlgG [Paracoccus denitrificans]MCU7428020.1 transcription antiterminator BlgG [Paracoccus denitrificans]QAR25649.1 transcription antiterminator BlgG [Paracoccus denitrificans]UPV96483.1 transcription antiterminator BlgG [Paracoccus denitrificans]WQO33406.1 transcription antiterminator BlgG [Paracoccus denitrificans]SDI24391.1 sulfate adenylyltransferase [Paracoccus denitrificans]